MEVIQRPGTGGRREFRSEDKSHEPGLYPKPPQPQGICPAFKLRHDEKWKQVNRKQTESPEIPLWKQCTQQTPLKSRAEMSGSSKNVTLSLMKMFLWEQFLSGGKNRPWDTVAQFSRPVWTATGPQMAAGRTPFLSSTCLARRTRERLLSYAREWGKLLMALRYA